MYGHQDWTPVVLKKKSAQPVIVAQKRDSTTAASVSTATNKPAWKIEKQVDGDAGKPLTYVSREDARKIIEGRVARKLTQKELAIAMNMNHKDIQDIESCHAVENKMILAKIKRYLNVQ